MSRSSKPSNQLGIIVNPFSGRDVRRVAARASLSDHHEKSQQVTRLVLGALSQGVDHIFLGRDAFRINEKATENLPERNKITILQYPLTHSANDTTTMAQMMWAAGCRVFIVLGGDGTSRIVAKALRDAILLPLSTGTNNVFPYRLEASVAGIAAGVVASGRLPWEQYCKRCKTVQIKTEQHEDIALIDAVLLENDFIGSLLPFAAKNLKTIVLTRAEPASIGISPIGGLLLPSTHHDDFGVTVHCAQDATRQINVAISPGLHENVGIRSINQLTLDEPLLLQGPGILAFDGDRSIKLSHGETATLTVRRDGPWIVEAEPIMRAAVEFNLFEKSYKNLIN